MFVTLKLRQSRLYFLTTDMKKHVKNRIDGLSNFIPNALKRADKSPRHTKTTEERTGTKVDSKKEKVIVTSKRN